MNSNKKQIISSIKTIYLTSSLPVVLCNDKIKSVWQNESAKSMLKKINLDLILSASDIEKIKNCIDKNIYDDISACFLPFLGCKVHITPVQSSDFAGALLIFNTKDEDGQEIYNKTDDIISVLSSNLRLPMHLITNAVDILNYDVEKIKVQNREKIRRSICVVENNTYKMYRICKNLSELIRFSTDTNSFETTVVKISEYINNLIDSCKEYVKLAGFNIIYSFSSLSGAPYWMAIDCEKFSLAISNIILNSCQYSNKYKNIIVDVLVTKKDLDISIKDEGFGMPKNKLKDVFRPYTTLDNKHYINKGIGIGLTLTKYIINQHNGSIEIQSKEEKGTTVKIIIPIVSIIDTPIIQINSGISFKSKMSMVAIQLSPLLY